MGSKRWPSSERGRTSIAPDLQYFMTMLMYEDSGRKIIPEHGFMVVFTLQRPESRGTIVIRSADPRVAPDIDPNYFDRSDRP